MRVLLTGAFGFVGSHLLDRLLQAGADVVCLDRAPAGRESPAGAPERVVLGDVRDPAVLRDAVAGVDRVFHLAGLTRSLTRREMLDTNTGGTARLLEALSTSGFSGRFVFCSSLSAVGPARDGTPHDERAPRAPITWYGESKAAAEAIVARHADRFETTVIRPCAVYGPRDRDFLGLFQSVQGGMAPVVGALDNRYSLVHADDLARAMIAAAGAAAAVGRTYFAAHPEVVTQSEIVSTAEGALGRSARQLVLPVSLMRLIGRVTDVVSQLTGRATLLGSQRIREVASAHWVCDPGALERDAGWRASIDLARGFAETVAWYREAGRLRAPPAAPGAVRSHV